MVAYQLDESQVTYRVPLEFITRVNGCYNDGATTYKFNMGGAEGGGVLLQGS
jgi:hypothetical protein